MVKTWKLSWQNMGITKKKVSHKEEFVLKNIVHFSAFRLVVLQMSEPPAKPARPARRRQRQAEGAKASDEGLTDDAVVRQEDAVAEGKTDKELANQMAEEKKKGRADRDDRLDNRSSHPFREDKESKETRRSVDFDKSAAGGDAGTAAPAKPANPPKKAPKPSGPDLLGVGKSDAEERDEILVRSTGRTPDTGVLNSLNSLLFSRFSIGYRLNSQSIATARDAVPYTIRGCSADTVWALCVNVQSMLADTTGLVRPAIKVHAVYKDSGECA